MKAHDLTGKIFGELIAQSPEIKDKKRGWNCVCSCGKTKWIPTFQLNSGNNKTCGDGLHKQSIKSGDRFGKLVVTGVYRDNRNRRYMTECLCDCGDTKPAVSFKNLQQGITTHCGCAPDNSNRGLPLGESARNGLINSYRGNAAKKGLEFTLTHDQCVSLFRAECYFCGKPPSEVYTKKGLKGSYTFSGIDRTDSSKGYVADNVVSCCTACNFLKGNRTNEQFLTHIRRICAHLMVSPEVQPT